MIEPTPSPTPSPLLGQVLDQLTGVASAAPCPAPPVGNPANDLGPAIVGAVCNPTTPTPAGADKPLSGIVQGIPDFLMNTGFGEWIQDFERGLVDAIRSAVSFWVNVPGPDLGTDDANPSDTVNFLRDSVSYLAGALLVAVLIVQMIKLMWSSDGERSFADIVRSLGLSVLVGGMSISVIVLASTICDEFSTWVLERSTEGTEIGGNLLFALTAPIGSGAVMVGGLVLAIIVAAIQCVIMLMRGGVVIILASTLTLTAAAWGTDMGRQAFKAQCGYLLAWLLVKPVGALIYATGFRLLGSDVTAPSGFVSILQGLAVLVTAVLALPMLIRLICPLTSPASQGQGFGRTMVALVAAAAVRK